MSISHFLNPVACPPPILKIPTLIRLGFFLPVPPLNASLPRERDLPKLGVLAPVQASLFPVFSGGLESVLEATSFAVNGLDAVGCGWQLV